MIERSDSLHRSRDPLHERNLAAGFTVSRHEVPVVETGVGSGLGRRDRAGRSPWESASAIALFKNDKMGNR